MVKQYPTSAEWLHHTSAHRTRNKEPWNQEQTLVLPKSIKHMPLRQVRSCANTEFSSQADVPDGIPDASHKLGGRHVGDVGWTLRVQWILENPAFLPEGVSHPE